MRADADRDQGGAEGGGRSRGTAATREPLAGCPVVEHLVEHLISCPVATRGASSYTREMPEAREMLDGDLPRFM
jgi:hypothetical protein